MTEGLAWHELDKLGYPNPRPYATIPEGLMGGADVSRLYAGGGMVYEFEERGGKTRAYLHRPEDLLQLERYKSYA